MSSAGLVNYYDSEDRRAVHINPVVVMGLSAVIGLIIIILNVIY